MRNGGTSSCAEEQLLQSWANRDPRASDVQFFFDPNMLGSEKVAERSLPVGPPR